MKMNLERAFLLASMSLLVASPLTAQEPPPVEPPAPEQVEPPPPPRTPPPPPRVEMRPSPATETAPPLAPETCSAQAYERARGAVVRVLSGGRVGQGALIADSAHVVTPLRVVEQGHGVDVIDADGNRRRARIVLTADSDGLAMLELDAALPGRPLPLAPWDGVHVGMPVVLVGAPSDHMPPRAPELLRGTLPWAASEGIVSARGPRAIQTDATVGTIAGSPLVSCAGELVALLGPSHELMQGPVVHTMPGVPALADLVSRLDRPESYGGRWNFTGGLALAGTYEDPGWLWGASLHVGLIGLDAFILGARFSYFFQNEDPVGTDVLTVHDDRYRGDAFVGWRQILAFGHFAMHFELALGASVTSVHRETRRAEVAVEGGAPVLRWRDEETQFWSVRPMAVVNLLHGPMLISYTLEVDIDREHVVHVFQLGARF